MQQRLLWQDGLKIKNFFVEDAEAIRRAIENKVQEAKPNLKVLKSPGPKPDAEQERQNESLGTGKRCI